MIRKDLVWAKKTSITFPSGRVRLVFPVNKEWQLKLCPLVYKPETIEFEFLSRPQGKTISK